MKLNTTIIVAGKQGSGTRTSNYTIILNDWQSPFH